ncbi:hypothetical protein PsorP6_009807 [Peronosclerospora sorghi]|uniref:Uncharacterized protein n=1 Tax=Peronosclerospora sorghi TaxID=230839 RepID=A0ACC0VZ03_9STRA|nr:hypothetical protein PsorP6_009807 [Peronosclerospora sorghi]
MLLPYYKGGDGIVLVCDVSDRRSSDIKIIHQYSPTKMPAMILVGNKIDLTNRVVTLEEVKEAASRYGSRFIGPLSCGCRNGSLNSSVVLVGVVETSAKTSKNRNGALENHCVQCVNDQRES